MNIFLEDTCSFCGDLVGVEYARSKRVSTSLPFLATEFLTFNIDGDGKNN